VIAAEDKGENKIGRIRLSIIPDASSDSLTSFIKECVEDKSTIRTDDWRGYSSLAASAYSHEVVKSVDLKIVHIVISLLKRWLLGTHQGAVSHEHLSYYLDEYVFRFNRRTSNHRGKLFYRLLQNAMETEPTNYKEMIKNVRGHNHNI